MKKIQIMLIFFVIIQVFTCFNMQVKKKPDPVINCRRLLQGKLSKEEVMLNITQESAKDNNKYDPDQVVTNFSSMIENKKINTHKGFNSRISLEEESNNEKVVYTHEVFYEKYISRIKYKTTSDNKYKFITFFHLKDELYYCKINKEKFVIWSTTPSIMETSKIPNESIVTIYVDEDKTYCFDIVKDKEITIIDVAFNCTKKENRQKKTLKGDYEFIYYDESYKNYIISDVLCKMNENFLKEASYYIEKNKMITEGPNRYFANLIFEFKEFRSKKDYSPDTFLSKIYSNNYGLPVVNEFYFFKYLKSKNNQLNQSLHTALFCDLNNKKAPNNLQDYFKLNDIASIIQGLDQNAIFKNINANTLYRGKKMNKNEYGSFQVKMVYETMTLLSTSINMGIALSFADGIDIISSTSRENRFNEDNSETAKEIKRSASKKKLSQIKGKTLNQTPEKITSFKTYGTSFLEVKTEKHNSQNSKLLENNIKTLVILNKNKDTPNCKFNGFDLRHTSQFDEQEVVIKPLSKFKLISKKENVEETFKRGMKEIKIQVNVLTFELVCDEKNKIIEVEKNINIY